MNNSRLSIEKVQLKARSGKFLVHNVGIHQAQAGMPVTFWDGTDDSKTAFLPKMHGSSIGTHHHIELHRQITQLFGFGNRMPA